ALHDALASLGKHAELTVGSVIPPRYDFLDPDKVVKRFNPASEALRRSEAVIVMDTGTWNQLGDVGTFIRELSVPKVVIDHHPTQDDLGATRLVDTKAEATGRLTYEALTALGVTPSPAA